MEINIVDTKGDFKKSVKSGFQPSDVNQVIGGFMELEKTIGKKIIAIIRGLRWSIDEMVFFTSKGVLISELTEVINGKVINFEISDL